MVLDSNVPIIANRRDGGSYACASQCAQELVALKKRGVLIVDDKGLILAEYRTYLNYSGQPGIGDAFLRWFFNNRGKADLCRTVRISHIDHEWCLFAEFPEDDELADFDKADQKFVATATSDNSGAKITQAGDHKWLRWERVLQRHNVLIRFVCETELQATAARKRGLNLGNETHK